MDINEFTELYINTDNETRKVIEQILKERQSPFEPLDSPFDTEHII